MQVGSHSRLRFAFSSSSFLHLVDELPEQVVRVVRAGRRFGMVLHARRPACRRGASPSTVPSFRFRCVTRHVGRQRVGIDREAVVLRRDLDLAGRRGPSPGGCAPRWPNFSLNVLPPSARPRIWWPRQMPNIGTSDVDELLHVVDGVRQRRRIAGAVAQEDAVRARRPAGPTAGAVAGNTRTSQPYAASRRRMFHLMPKS